MPFKDPEVRKQKSKEYSRRYYERNREKVIAQNNALKRKATKRWEEFKKTLKCINCGFDHHAALDFHHVTRDPDNVKINTLVKNNAYKAAKREIAKCVPLCANCHRIHHYEEHKHNKARRKQLKQSLPARK
jgi:hypothetical protein